MKALEVARPNLPQKPAAKSGKPSVKGKPDTVNDDCDDDDISSAAAMSKPSSKAAASKASKPSKKVQFLFCLCYFLFELFTVTVFILLFC